MVHLPMSTHLSLGDMGAFDQKLNKLLEHKRHLSASVLLPPSIQDEDVYKLGSGKRLGFVSPELFRIV